MSSFKTFYFQPAHSYYFSRLTMRRALRQAGFRPDVSVLQRYSLGNHLNWIFHGRPQPKPTFSLPMPLTLVDDAYRAVLRMTGRADTLYAIGARLPSGTMAA